MRAVILAGGKGSRLKPYTITLPKPLVPVGEEPILKLLLISLRNQGIKEATICVNHMRELIESYFGDGSQLGIKIKYSHEDKPLGTVAPIKKIKTLPEDFLVINGDTLTDLSYSRLYREHKFNNCVMTVATCQRQVTVDYGVIKYGPDQMAREFVEKPAFNVDVSMGINVFNKQVFKYIPDDIYFGFDDLMDRLLAAGEKVHIYEHKGYWLDIGRPEDYEKANEDVARARARNKTKVL